MNSGRTSGLLIVYGDLADDLSDRLKLAYSCSHAGPAQDGVVAVVSGDLTFEALSLSLA